MPDRQDLRAVGERIASLLDRIEQHADPATVVATEDLVRQVTDLYGAALARVVELADPELLSRLSEDELVASLLVVHDLHPMDTATRVRDALDGVRPLLAAHEGDVELLAVEGETVRLRLLGSCHGCPSSTVTLKMAVEQAVLDAAPEITTIDVPDEEPSDTPVRLSTKPSFDPLACPAGDRA